MLCLAHRNSSANDRENDLAIVPSTWVGFFFISPLKFCSLPQTHNVEYQQQGTVLTWDAPATKGSQLQQHQVTTGSKDVLYLENKASSFQQCNFCTLAMLAMLNKYLSKIYFTIIIHYPGFLNQIYWPACKLSLMSQVPSMRLWDGSSLRALLCVCILSLPWF